MCRSTLYQKILSNDPTVPNFKLHNNTESDYVGQCNLPGLYGCSTITTRPIDTG